MDYILFLFESLHSYFSDEFQNSSQDLGQVEHYGYIWDELTVKFLKKKSTRALTYFREKY